MALQHVSTFRSSLSSVTESSWLCFSPLTEGKQKNAKVVPARMVQTRFPLQASLGNSILGGNLKSTLSKGQKLRSVDRQSEQAGEIDDDGLNSEERLERRRKIREVLDMNPNIPEEIDPDERVSQTQKLVSDYPLVMEEEDPDWPEDDNGWGFKLGEFFNKITIKNVRKDDDDDYDSDKEVVWQDDNYIRPVKDITAEEWEETVFKDLSPLIVVVHNRYRRPKENEKIWDELTKAVHIIWDCRLPSPRCVAIDAVVECELASALRVSVFPEIIFTKAGRILYREKGIRTADELSKIMAFFYYGAAKPPCLNDTSDDQEAVPSAPSNS